MTFNRMQLLRMCRGFFLQTTIFTAVSIGGCFYAYHAYRVFGLSIMVIGSLGILPFFFINTYLIIDDITKMNTDFFEGKIERRVFSDILPYGVIIINLEKEREKSGTYHLSIKEKKIIPVGSWIKIRYLKKSRIIIDFEVEKMETEDSLRVINWWL